MAHKIARGRMGRPLLQKIRRVNWSVLLKILFAPFKKHSRRNTRSMVLAKCQLMVYLQGMCFATSCATSGSKLEKMIVSLANSKITSESLCYFSMIAFLNTQITYNHQDRWHMCSNHQFFLNISSDMAGVFLMQMC